MLQVVLQYHTSLQDGKNVFRILTDFNVTILKTKEKSTTISQVTILVKDNDTLNRLMSKLNYYCTYDVSVVKRLDITIPYGAASFKFNWFHRMMWKLFFGAKIENLKEK